MNRGEFPDSNLVAVYGTLRKGFGNHERILANQEGVKFIGQTTIEGFEMRSLGGFPGIYPTNKQDSVVVEVYEVTSPSVRLRLDGLESFHSSDHHWYNRVLIDTEYGTAYAYVFDSEEQIQEKGRLELVESGDWAEFQFSRYGIEIN